MHEVCGFLSCTCAGPPIRQQGVAFAAAALVASFGVCTLRVTAPIHDHALVNVCGNSDATTSLVSSTSSQRQAFILLKQILLKMALDLSP